jgi:two-component system, OmpR family, response regulator
VLSANLKNAKIFILVVDDEPEVRAVLREALEEEGYLVVEAGGKAEALSAFAAHPINLITLDLRLAHENGLDLAREFRAKRNVPVIMITGKDDALDRIVGLELGADDYITKPFHVREVLLRVRNALKRYDLHAADQTSAETPAGRVFAFDHCRLNSLTRELKTTQGDVIDLTDYEFRLLSLFVSNPGRVFSRAELSLSLSGHDWSPLDRTIDGHVARLRRKIEATEDEPRMIKSVRNVGYVFAGDVVVQ